MEELPKLATLATQSEIDEVYAYFVIGVPYRDVTKLNAISANALWLKLVMGKDLSMFRTFDFALEEASTVDDFENIAAMPYFLVFCAHFKILPPDNVECVKFPPFD